MILMMGPSGAGKSSQTKQLQMLHPELVGIGPGDLLRQTTDPKLQAGLLDGKLLDDKIVTGLMWRAIESISKDKEVILDGFPRRMAQIGPMEEFLKGQSQTIRSVIVLTISRETAEKRLAARARHDDAPGSIERRWQIFETETKPVIEYYRERSLVHEISGEGEIATVTALIETVLGY